MYSTGLPSHRREARAFSLSLRQSSTNELQPIDRHFAFVNDFDDDIQAVSVDIGERNGQEFPCVAGRNGMHADDVAVRDAGAHGN